MEDDVTDQFYDDYEEFSSLTGEVGPPQAPAVTDDSGHVMEDSATDLSSSSSRNSLDLSINTVKRLIHLPAPMIYPRESLY